jgi:hypothetical protein
VYFREPGIVSNTNRKCESGSEVRSRGFIDEGRNSLDGKNEDKDIVYGNKG